MIAVILQPSYIPWRGYFDQIRRADLFIFYDDVQYDKHGWRNRNQIKSANGKQWLTIPVHSQGVTQGVPIRDVQIDWRTAWPEKHLKALTSSYARAPHFKEYQPLLDEFYGRHDSCIADFTIETTIRIARELGTGHTRFMRSSELTGIDGHRSDRSHSPSDRQVRVAGRDYGSPDSPCPICRTRGVSCRTYIGRSSGA